MPRTVRRSIETIKQDGDELTINGKWAFVLLEGSIEDAAFLRKTSRSNWVLRDKEDATIAKVAPYSPHRLLRIRFGSLKRAAQGQKHINPETLMTSRDKKEVVGTYRTETEGREAFLDHSLEGRKSYDSDGHNIYRLQKIEG